MAKMPDFNEYEHALCLADDIAAAETMPCPACGAEGSVRSNDPLAVRDERDLERVETFRCRDCGYAVQVSDTYVRKLERRVVDTVCPGMGWDKG